ncbi:relaxase/mobilization nuclease domain-containing protein [Sphingobacterium hotanense]|uniref:Relaxase/mobilization nuclease domain-containing protein n=1 Tax=Sphingobacterium hotanense TaxID=649196 RepID=A0ABT7NSD7_9SPHI|nr:relaxase/mobilization nuclease domain-containing protein [Sphingobacterium hotanense]MDM1050154.1 relaxase/mobilization nuclease domain-containing protein [Sphingobacterium hotanense]
MIAKIIKTNASFSASLDYCLNREKASIIYSDGVRIGSSEFMARQFELLASSNDRMKNSPLGHIVLSFSKDLNGKISDNMMNLIAKDYLLKMGIKDTAVLVIRHEDRKHPHCHIIYSKIDYVNNKKLKEGYIKLKSLKAVREINQKYGFNRNQYQTPFTESKSKFFQTRKEVAYYLHQGVSGKNPCKNWAELQQYLFQKGIHVEFKAKGKSDVIQGVSFSKDGFKFKGSELGLSYSKIEDQFSQSQSFYDFKSISHVNNLEGNVVHEKMTKNDESILSILLSPDVGISGDQDDEQMKKRKRKMKL